MRTVNYLFMLTAVLCCLFVMSSCQSDDDDSSGDGQSQIDDQAEQSGCLESKAGGVSLETIHLEYAYGTLYVEHLYTCRNCVFTFDGDYSVEDGAIKIVEGNSEDEAAFCMCFYNVNYVISDVPAEKYKLSILTKDINGEIDALLEEEVDFTNLYIYDFEIGEHECG